MTVDLFYPHNTPPFVLAHFTILTSLLDISQFMPLLLTSFLKHITLAIRRDKYGENCISSNKMLYFFEKDSRN